MAAKAGARKTGGKVKVYFSRKKGSKTASVAIVRAGRGRAGKPIGHAVVKGGVVRLGGLHPTRCLG